MEWKYVIAVTLLLLLLAFLIPGAVNQFKNIYRASFFQSDWDSLTQPEKSNILVQADVFIRSMQMCRNATKQACMCNNVIIDFPDEVLIKITHSSDEKISIIFGKTELKNFTMQSTFINGISLLSKENIAESKQNYENFITFKQGNKYFNGDKIISSGIYKPYLSRLGIITTDKNSEGKQIPLIALIPSC